MAAAMVAIVTTSTVLAASTPAQKSTSAHKSMSMALSSSMAMPAPTGTSASTPAPHLPNVFTSATSVSPSIAADQPGPATRTLFDLPYHVIEQIIAETLSLPPVVTYKCPYRFLTPFAALKEAGSAGSTPIHFHPSCGAGPGWSCVLEPASEAGQDASRHDASISRDDRLPRLAVQRAHSLLHAPVRRLLVSRTFEIEVRARGPFFAAWAGEEALARLAEFPLHLARRVQITVRPCGMVECLAQVGRVLGGRTLRELDVLVLDESGGGEADGAAMACVEEAAAASRDDAERKEGSKEKGGAAEKGGGEEKDSRETRPRRGCGHDGCIGADGPSEHDAESARADAAAEVVECPCPAAQAAVFAATIGQVTGAQAAKIGVAGAPAGQGESESKLVAELWRLEPRDDGKGGKVVNFGEWEWLYQYLIARTNRSCWSQGEDIAVLATWS